MGSTDASGGAQETLTHTRLVRGQAGCTSGLQAVSRLGSCKTTAIAFDACICCHNVSMVCPPITIGGLASDRIGDFAARIFSPRAPRPRLRPGVRQEEPRRAQAPSLALAVVPAPLVLGESCGSRCQPTAAARGKPMTSTNGSGGHGFVPPKPMRVQDADTTRLSRTGIRPDVTMPIQNKTRACATQHHTNNYNK